MDLLERAQAWAPRLVELRRDLHRHPELSFREIRTAGVAAAELREAGYTVKTGIAHTGVVGELENGPGPTVALRADMDALPILEENAVSYASTVPGVMHACGHDFHVAGLTGAARLLAELRAEGGLPAGRVRILFQPSEEASDEEGKSGAQRLVEAGVMRGVDAVVGLHVGAHLPVGQVFLTEGPFLGGSDEVVVHVYGKGSHAARPHEGIDAVALAALGIVAAQQVVSRSLAPGEQGVVTFGTIQGGTAPNVICDRVRIHGTLRYFDPEVRRRIHDGIRRAFATVEAMGGRSEVQILGGYPPVVNDPQVTGWVREALTGTLGSERVVRSEPTLLAEDFSFLAQEAPGAFFWLGAALPEPREHHHPRFDVDEGMLPVGAALLAQSAVHLLRRLGEAERPREG